MEDGEVLARALRESLGLYEELVDLDARTRDFELRVGMMSYEEWKDEMEGIESQSALLWTQQDLHTLRVDHNDEELEKELDWLSRKKMILLSHFEFVNRKEDEAHAAKEAQNQGAAPLQQPHEYMEGDEFIQYANQVGGSPMKFEEGEPCATTAEEIKVEKVELREEGKPNIILGEVIGQGRHGVVFKGYWCDGPAAIKALPHKPNKKHLAREIQSLQKLRHPNVVAFYDAISHNGHPLLVMEFASGGNLRKKLDEGHVFSACEKLRILRDVSVAMKFAHGHGIIHRDLRCENLFIFNMEGELVVKVGDFGLSRFVASNMTKPIGYAGWIAKEVLELKDYGLPYDVYSFGVIMYELLTSGRPEVNEHWSSFPRSEPEGTTPGLWNLMKRCLSEEKDRPTFAEILDELKAMLDMDM